MTAPTAQTGEGQGVADVLERAANLLTPEGAWTQGAMARNAKGLNTGLSGFRGAPVCWCIMGATSSVAGNSGFDYKADHLLRIVVGEHLSAWNDAPGRTQSEVVAALRKAAALAREQGL